MTARLANTYSESARSRGVSGLEALQSDFILSRPSGKSHRGPVLIKAPQWLTHTIWVLLASQQLELLRYSTSFPMSSKVLLCVCACVREWRLTLGTGKSVYIKLPLWLVGFQACGDGFGLPKRLSWQTSTILCLPRSSQVQSITRYPRLLSGEVTISDTFLCSRSLKYRDVCMLRRLQTFLAKQTDVKRNHVYNKAACVYT